MKSGGGWGEVESGGTWGGVKARDMKENNSELVKGNWGHSPVGSKNLAPPNAEEGAEPARGNISILKKKPARAKIWA